MSEPGAQYDRVQRTTMRPSRSAELEARRILEETEPATRMLTGSLGCIEDPNGPNAKHESLAMLRLVNRTTGGDKFFFSLASSLSAFLTAPDPAAYLAKMQEGE